MLEVSSNVPAIARCQHGNVARNCEQCQQGKAGNGEVVAQELHDGLPVISSEEFSRLYNTDVRALGSLTAATFDFRGFVRAIQGVGEHYVDAMATNGLRKDEQQPGIHVGTDGITNYSYNRPMSSPKQVGEYVVYIEVPGRLQKKMGVVCKYDSCFTADGFKKQFDTDDQEIAQIQVQESGHIVVRLSVDPKEDTLARQKAKVIHDAITKYIENGGAVEQIKDRVADLEERLQDVSSEDLMGDKKVLQQE
ncbi:hypothetical protein HZA86_02380 [Candidatus Uhrbacteria bacterium]|nr:hypothetical protein [Candidatus Uhrbacteria bacterium]